MDATQTMEGRTYLSSRPPSSRPPSSLRPSSRHRRSRSRASRHRTYWATVAGAVVIALMTTTFVGWTGGTPARAVFGVFDGRHRWISPGEVAGGALPRRTTVADDWYPALRNLDPDLMTALRAAAADAARDGVTLRVNGGWRSAEYQSGLLRDAVREHGSVSEAARWVASPETSPHVAGEAVDLVGTGTADWIAAHGSRYGLCRIYQNEPWHVELRAAAVHRGCPKLYADPSADPRLRA